MPRERAGGPTRIDILHACGHTSRGVMVDCLNIYLLPRWRAQPCPACRAQAPVVSSTHTPEPGAGQSGSCDTRGNLQHEEPKHGPAPG